jgi:glycine/D-amino acid oxidase-like deaminating enzyme
VKSVVIIAPAIGGLAVALRLRKLGFEVTEIEKP